MMMEVKEELIIFLLAVVSGGIVRLSYRFLHCVRQIVRHNLLAIEIEDFFVLDLLGTVFVCANLPYNFWKYQVAFRTRCCVWSGYFFACSVES